MILSFISLWTQFFICVMIFYFICLRAIQFADVANKNCERIEGLKFDLLIDQQIAGRNKNFRCHQGKLCAPHVSCEIFSQWLFIIIMQIFIHILLSWTQYRGYKTADTVQWKLAHKDTFMHYSDKHTHIALRRKFHIYSVNVTIPTYSNFVIIFFEGDKRMKFFYIKANKSWIKISHSVGHKVYIRNFYFQVNYNEWSYEDNDDDMQTQKLFKLFGILLHSV